MSIIRIVIIESPNPIDLFVGRSEAKALEESCRLIGHEAISFIAKSRVGFQEICNYLASADSIHTNYKSLPLFIHISSHGNDDCVVFGNDVLSWEMLNEDLLPIFENQDYEGKIALSISACGSGQNKVSRYAKAAWIESEQTDLKIPKYIFSNLGETINWDDALVAWVLFYHKISSISLDDTKEVISVLEKIRDCMDVHFNYKRWSESKNAYYNWPKLLDKL